MSPRGVALQSFPVEFAALLAASEFLVGAVAVSSSSSQCEWVKVERDYEPKPPCTMVDCQGRVRHSGGARRRNLDEHELMHFVFEHGVSQGLRLAECRRGQERARAVDRQDGNVFDTNTDRRRA